MGKYLVCLLLPFDFLLIPFIALLAVFGRYPRWFVTPDDPTSPFGLYEPAMRRAYYGTDTPKPMMSGWWHQVGGRPTYILWERPVGWRRWWGSFLWLGLRNRMYGFAYAMKPACLRPALLSQWNAAGNGIATPGTYEHLLVSSRQSGRVTVFEANGYKMWKVLLCHIGAHPFGIMFGYKVDSIVMDRHTPRKPINMEGRPICSLRRLD